MIEHITQNWRITKPGAQSAGGVVASQHRVASGVGARVLREGGNAIDAAAAASFALAAIEPWNSGLGGVGYMLVYVAREKRVHVVDFAPISPMHLDPRDFPLIGGTTTELFTWASVKDDRNIHGPFSFAVPGNVAGIGLAVERFGRRSFAEAVGPAIALAEEGMPVDWFLTLKTTTFARELARYDRTREIWLPGGYPPVSPPGGTSKVVIAALADTLRRLAHAGHRDFYEGEIAGRIANDVKAMGGVLGRDDLRAYQARVVEPLECRYRDARVMLAPGLTGGPSMAQTLARLEAKRFTAGGPRTDAFVAYAEALREAYATRLATMGDTADRRDPSSTTHLNVIDREGNMVALTQTLLSVFGSKVVLPSTGILMNNGIMWFDPEPGKPNSLAPGKRPLTNMCPVIALAGDAPWFAIGGSGGRKIMPAVMQITSFLVDHRLSLEAAFHQPRIDASGEATVSVDPRLPDEVKSALAERFPVRTLEPVVLPNNYACPSAVLADRNNSGERFGMSDLMSPWSGAVAE